MKVEFREEKIGFTIIFYRKNFEKENEFIKNDTVNDTANDTANDTVKLNKTEQKIIKLLRKNQNLTQKEIGNELNLSEITIKRNISKLKEKGLLKRIGADKNGYWKIIQK